MKRGGNLARAEMPPRSRRMTRTSFRQVSPGRDGGLPAVGLVPARKPRRNAPLPARSEKTKRRYVTRRELVARLLDEFPWCLIRWDAGCEGRSVDVHEPGMRSRLADICDPDQCVVTCRYCHRRVHDNPAEATRRGWLIPSGNAAPEPAGAA